MNSGRDTICTLKGAVIPDAPQSVEDPDSTIQDTGAIDTPGDLSTTDVLAVSSHVFGTVAGDDHDWYVVELTAGVEYTFETTLLGGTDPDTILTLRDSDGNQIAQNDDIVLGVNRASLLTFTAAETGTYYIDVSQWNEVDSTIYGLILSETIDAPDDYADNTSTTGTVAIGGSVDGIIEAPGDEDWFAVTLTAGQSYYFNLTAQGDPPLGDPYLRLFNSSGVQVAFNDDGGSGLNSSLRFTATEDGVYYISAEAYSSETGHYQVTAELAPPQDPVDTIDWGTQLGSTNISIYFATSGETFGSATADRNWTASEIAAAMAAAATYSAVTNLTFTQTGNSASADFILVLDNDLSGDGQMNTPPTSPAVGIIRPDPSYFNDVGLTPGGYGFFVLVHELGHGVGLAHPHDNGGTSEIMEGVISPFGSYGAYGLNRTAYTVMSYNHGLGATSGHLTGYAATPMALDIAAVQADYGAAATNPGDTFYDLADFVGQFATIWDSGGTDTLGYTGSLNLTIDIRSATLLPQLDGGGGYHSGVLPSWGVSIASGVVIENASGGSGDDEIRGNDLGNSLSGGGGDDVLDGAGGDDVLDGGAGSDEADFSSATGALNIDLSLGGAQVIPGLGSDTLISIERLRGSSFDDTLAGDAADNRLYGEDGDDTLIGRLGNDVLDGGSGDDTVTFAGAAGPITVNLGQSSFQNTGEGSDQFVSIENLIGSDFDDVLTGRSGANHLQGGDGDDILNGANGDDVIDGGDGSDTAAFSGSGGVTVDLSVTVAQNTGVGNDRFISIENLIGTTGADTLTGDAGDNIIEGGQGADTLNGGGGTDTLSFANASSGRSVDLSNTGAQQTGEGNDTISNFENVLGSAHNDNLKGDDGANVLDGGDGDDTLEGGLGDDTLRGGAGSDTASYASVGAGVEVSLAGPEPHVVPGAGSDTYDSIENLLGSAFNDVLTGDSGNNRLSGGDGDDELEGGLGDDELVGGSGTDFASFANASVGVVVNLSLSGAQNTGLGNDTLTSIEGVIGSAFDDNLRGGFSADDLRGGAGDDTIEGGSGSDNLDGGAGTDTLSFANASSGRSADLSNSGAQQTGEGHDTISNFENVLGSAFDDELTGDAGDNELTGAAGDDILEGGLGDDTLRGGAGSDTASYASVGAGVEVSLAAAGPHVVTGAGTDTYDSIENLLGSAYSDRLTGDSGDNRLSGGSGDDELEGGLGDDELIGGSGTDFASYASAPSGVTVSLAILGAQNTGAGSDTLSSIEGLIGSDFDDQLTGRTGSDILRGGAGDDVIEGGSGHDQMDGGAGVDTASFSSAFVGVTVSLANAGSQNTGDGFDTLAGFENLLGSAFDDQITGDSGDNELTGGGGDDILEGGLGDDTLRGGAGSDTASYASASAGVEVSLAAAGPHVVTGAGSDTFDSIENLLGSGFNDRLTGDAGDNRLSGGNGDDELEGGLGDDELIGGSGTDFASYANAASGVTVSLAIAGGQNTIGAGNDTLSLIEGLIGSAFDDELTGGIGSDDLRGGAGDDVIEGGSGHDKMDGGAGVDTASYASALFGVTVSLATTTAQGTGEGNDTLAGFENLLGSAFDDELTGDAGDNELTGGAGDDVLEGGLGANRLVGGAGVDAASYAGAGAGVTVSLISTAQNTGGAGADTLIGIEAIFGSAFDDQLSSGASGGRLEGRGGDDLLVGAAGDDVLNGGAGVDTVSYAGLTSAVTVSLAIAVAQATGHGMDTLLGVENLVGTDLDDVLTGDGQANRLDGGDGDDLVMGGLGTDVLIGGDGIDTVSYAGALVGVSVSLALSTAQAVIAGAIHTISGFENLTGSGQADTLTGDGGENRLVGGLGSDIISGGANVDTAVFAGNFADYTISTSGFTATVTGADGVDTLTGVEFFEFDDLTFHWRPGTGQEIDFGADPDTFMSQIRDFDGNNLGAADSWELIGSVDVQGDGDLEYLFFNREIGRWATVGPDENGLVYFDDHGWAGDTRVVGIYVDPLVESGEVEAGSDHDSQRRFQNDLFIGNIAGILGAGDYNDDGLQEIYFSLTDGTAYLHAYMHADGNIQYANYQNQQQVEDYMADNGVDPSVYDGWFPDVSGLITPDILMDDFTAT